MGLRSSSPCSPLETGEQTDNFALPRQGSSNLAEDAQELIKFISQRYTISHWLVAGLRTLCREGRRPRWPFADISGRSGEVSDLFSLVNKIIRVFNHTGPPDLKVDAVW